MHGAPEGEGGSSIVMLGSSLCAGKGAHTLSPGRPEGGWETCEPQDLSPHRRDFKRSQRPPPQPSAGLQGLPWAKLFKMLDDAFPRDSLWPPAAPRPRRNAGNLCFLVNLKMFFSIWFGANLEIHKKLAFPCVLTRFEAPAP